MRKCLLSFAISVLAGGAVPAFADVVQPYSFDFNNEITTSVDNGNYYPDPIPDFKCGPGWGHIIDYAHGYSDRYVQYTWNATSGVGGTGALSVESQDNAYEQNGTRDLKDLLVTPKLSGTVTLQVKKLNRWSYESNISFYKVNDDMTAGDLIQTFSASSLSADFTTCTITLDASTRIGIRGSEVVIDNLTAESADLVLSKGLTISSVSSENQNNYTDCDADGKYKIGYSVTLSNSGDVDLNPGDEGFSVSLLDNAGNELRNVPITEALASGKTLSTPVQVRDTLLASQYPDPSSFFIRENISGTKLLAATEHPVAFEPTFDLKTGGNAVNSGDTQVFPKSQHSKSFVYSIENNGASTLKVNGGKISGPFTTTLEACEVAPHESVMFIVATKADEPGVHTGNLTISADGFDDFNLPLKSEVIDSTLWFVDFENSSLPADMDDQSDVKGNNSGNWNVSNVDSQLGMQGNQYCLENYSDDLSRLITPALKTEDGKFTLDVARDNRRPELSRLDIYYSTDKKQWHLLRSLSANPENAADTITGQAVSVDESGFIADYYKFATTTVTGIPANTTVFIALDGAHVKVDNLLCGKRAEVAHNFSIKNFNAPQTGEVNSQFAASVTVANKSLKAENANGYKVTLHFGTETVSAPSVNIASGATTTFNFTLTPHAEGAFKVWAEVSDASTDYSLSSDTATVNVSEENSMKEIVVGHDTKPYYAYVPLSLSGWGSASETIYPQELLSDAGLQNGDRIVRIAYNGYNTTYSDPGTIDVNIQAWIENTEDTEFPTPTAFASTDNMTSIADGTYTIPKAGSASEPAEMLSIRPAEAFVYNGNSLRLRIQDTGFTGWGDVTFENDGSETSQSIYSTEYSEPENDEFSDPSYSRTMPVVHLFIAQQPAKAEGKVVDAEGKPVAGATVSYTSGDVLYHGVTADDGTYSIDIVKSKLAYGVRAEKTGYFPAIIDSVDIAQQQTLTLRPADAPYIDNVNIPAEGMVNTAYTATARVINYEAKDYAAGSYTVQLVVNDSVVASVAGIELKSGSSTPVSLTFTPHHDGNVTAYILVKPEEGKDARSDEKAVSIAPESGLATVQVGEAVTTDSHAPAYLWSNKSQSMTVYSADELGLKGGDRITSIAYKGYVSSFADSSKFNFRVWVQNTDMAPSEIPGSINIDELTPVFDDSLNVEAVGSSAEHVTVLNFQLSEPVTYEAGKNLMIVVEASGNNTSYPSYESQGDDHPALYRYSFGSDDDFGAWSMTSAPVAYLTVDRTGHITGMVADSADNSPIADASVTVSSNGVEYYATTAEDGTFSVDATHAELEYTATVSAEGYITKTITGLKFVDGELVINASLAKEQTTAISEVDVQAAAANKIYTIDGKQVKASSISSLPGGVYIITNPATGKSRKIVKQ